MRPHGILEVSNLHGDLSPILGRNDPVQQVHAKVRVSTNTILSKIFVSQRERQWAHRTLESTAFGGWLRDNNVQYSPIKEASYVVALADPLAGTFFHCPATLEGLG